MKKYRKLEARKRIDELHNQVHIIDVVQANLALQQHLEGLEKEFKDCPQAAPKKRKIRKAVIS
jgi:hypothetical protein